jgi:hypothetical protein
MRGIWPQYYGGSCLQGREQIGSSIVVDWLWQQLFRFMLCSSSEGVQLMMSWLLYYSQATVAWLQLPADGHCCCGF